MFPPLDDARRKELADSIEANGQRDPITLFDPNTILDGRNRYEACKLKGIAPKTELWDGKGSPYQFVLDKNGRRRDLEPDQRVAITMEVLEADEEWQEAQAAKKDRANAKRSDATKSQPRGEGGRRLASGAGPRGPAPDERTAEEIAKRSGASPRTVKRVIELRKKDPSAFEKLKKGEVKAHSELRGIKHAEARRKAADAAKAAPVQAQLHKADAIDFLRTLKPQSVDLLVTDPPYMTDVDDIVAFAKSWVPLAFKCVKPTGRLYIFTGAYSQELHAYLSVFLKQDDFTCPFPNVWSYDNTIGPAPKTDYKLNWQAYHHLRGPKAPPLDCPIKTELFSAQEINAPDGRLGDRFHAWQKPDALAEQIIRHASKPGDFVVDPFAGTGTFLLAAAKFGRNSVGCDIDDKMIKIARERGCELASGVLSLARVANG